MSNVIQLRRPNEICCSGCGSIAEASCDCGKPYVLAVDRAAEAVLAHPEKSNRVIAGQVGVSHQTVGRARKKSVGPDGPPETRTGKDGKQYKARKPRAANDDTKQSPKQKRDELLFGLMVRADEAAKFAFYDADYVTDEALAFVRRTAAAWCELLATLERKI